MKTVRVRIAVAVDQAGNWNSFGYSKAKGDDHAASMAMDCFDPEGMKTVVFIEAEIELPEPQTIEGKVIPQRPNQSA